MTGGTTAPRAAARDGVTATQRLRSTRDIRAVFASRCTAASALATVHARRRGDHKAPRMTVAAGKAVGNAVARNRVKRRLRAALRDTVMPAGGDFVVVGRAPALTAPQPTLQTALTNQIAAAWARCA